MTFVHSKSVSLPGTKGTICVAKSSDRGVSWDSTFTLFDSHPGARYPTGGIYNPAGNTDPSQAFAIVTGGIFDSVISSWTGNFMASRKLDGTHNYSQVLYNSVPGAIRQHYAGIGSSAHSNGKFYSLGYYIDSSGVIPEFKGAVLNIATFDSSSSSFAWTQKSIYHAFSRNSTGKQLYDGIPNMAWSKDGTVGYIVFFGRDSIQDFGYSHPILYKSVDEGETWSKVPAFNFRNLKILTDSLLRSHDGNGPQIPVWEIDYGHDIIVDGFNQPHIVSVVDAVSDTIAGTTHAIPRVFDVFLESNLTWNAFNVSILQTIPVDENISDFFLPYNARIMVSKDSSGKILFYSWLDTDPTLALENRFPNIWSQSLDITTWHSPRSSCPTNFSVGGSYDGDNFWLYTSQEIYQNGSGTITYKVPCTTCKPFTSGDPFPVLHSNASGIKFIHPNDYDGIWTPIYCQWPISTRSTTSDSDLAVFSSPNPFSDFTELTINVSDLSSGKLRVMDLLGKVLFEKSIEIDSEAKIRFYRNKLSAGIYIYSVESDNKIAAGKLVIE